MNIRNTEETILQLAMIGIAQLALIYIMLL